MVDPYVTRMAVALERATPPTKAAGLAWYPTARRVARQLARQHGVTLATAAGVLAATSPNAAWASNQTLASRMLARGAGYGLAAEKVDAILAGARPHDVLRGPKVRAFYRAIMGDTEAITIDLWMARLLSGGTQNQPRGQRDYDAMASATRAAARLFDIPPRDAQAIAWIHIRGAAA